MLSLLLQVLDSSDHASPVGSVRSTGLQRKGLVSVLVCVTPTVLLSCNKNREDLRNEIWLPGQVSFIKWESVLPCGMFKNLCSEKEVSWTGHGGTHLSPQHLGGWNRIPSDWKPDQGIERELVSSNTPNTHAYKKKKERKKRKGEKNQSEIWGEKSTVSYVLPVYIVALICRVFLWFFFFAYLFCFSLLWCLESELHKHLVTHWTVPLALILRSHIGPGVGLQAFNPGMLEAETGGSLCIQGHPGMHNDFQASLGYTVRPCLKKGVGIGIS